MTTKSSGDLPNEKGFSNVVDWTKVGEVAETVVKDTLGRNNTGKKDDVIIPKPAPVSEKKILGLHPMTFIITTVSILALSITGIIIYKKFNK